VGLLERLLARMFPPEPETLGSVRPRPRRPLTVRGRVVARDTLESPLAGARCVYYRYLVEEWRTGMVPISGAGLWHPIEADEAIAEFYLDDGTGRALVEPERADIEADLAGQDHDADRRRAREWRFGAGDLVEVEGVTDEVADLLDGDRGYRDPATRLLIQAPEGGRLRIRVLERAS
jgi:hypothetical protein